MEFKENAAVENAQRQLLFNQIGWLNKAKFEEYLSVGIEIHPNLKTNEESTNLINRIFVGKSIASSADNTTGLEVIGTVFRKFETGEWVLNVPHGSTVYQIKSDFLVLSIHEPDTFQWVKTSKNQIPRYALRAAVDNLTKEYFYVGRTCQNISATYYGSYRVNNFNEPIPNLFGKVHVTHSCLYAPFNNLELIFKDYEILCMKPTPNKLKIISRELVRKLAKHSNENIEKINTNSNRLIYVPNSLISFIKYPSHLSSGEYMLQNEKIVRDDGKFELAILDNRNLVIRSVISSDESNKLSKLELDNLKVTQLERVIYNSVNSIWLHKFHAIVYNNDWQNHKKVLVLKEFPLNLTTDYKIRISNDNIPKLEVFTDVDNEKEPMINNVNNLDDDDDEQRNLDRWENFTPY